MPKLTTVEKKQHRSRLSEWQTPDAMAAYVSMVNDKMGSADFFRQPGVEFLRDAWLAAEFGRHRRSSHVRLVPEHERWPDFEARTNGADERVECCEADLPGRRRGEEYRHVVDGESKFEDDPVEDWIERAEQAPAALLNAIRKKAAKNYGTGASLLVFLNIGEYGIRQAKIESSMEKASKSAFPHFARLWILWKDQLYGPWPRSELHTDDYQAGG